jgi:hypothetical protein
MTSNVKIYKDGYAETHVRCPYCFKVNRHSVTGAFKNVIGTTLIDYSQLGARTCDNIKCPKGVYYLTPVS